MGDAFCVADLTAAALLGAIVDAPNFEYPLPQPFPAWRRLEIEQATLLDQLSYLVTLADEWWLLR